MTQASYPLPRWRTETIGQVQRLYRDGEADPCVTLAGEGKAATITLTRGDRDAVAALLALLARALS